VVADVVDNIFGLRFCPAGGAVVGQGQCAVATGIQSDGVSNPVDSGAAGHQWHLLTIDGDDFSGTVFDTCQAQHQRFDTVTCCRCIEIDVVK